MTVIHNNQIKPVDITKLISQNYVTLLILVFFVTNAFRKIVLFPSRFIICKILSMLGIVTSTSTYMVYIL